MSSESRSSPPHLALTAGDPAGIGPEIARAALADPRVREAARLTVLGPAAARPDEVPAPHAWSATDGPDEWRMGEVQAECGRAALAALRAGAALAESGAAGALVTGPVSKAALHLAGEEVEGQTELLARWAGVARYGMLAIAGPLRVLLLTRHMPLKRALERITPASVLEHLELLDSALRELGCERPRIALAGLNPHAGEGGLLGDEEQLLLEPALALACDRGILASGPHSPDALFPRAARGEFDGVLALYHDQAFIPVKLLSGAQGVTLIAGLPYLRVSPVHGTAFDIAGTGRASPENLIQAILFAAREARRRAGRGAEEVSAPHE